MATRKTTKEEERAARAAERLRQQKAAERRTLALRVGGAVLAIAAVVGIVVLATHKSGSSSKATVTDSGQVLPAPVTGAVPTVQKQVATEPNTTGIEGVVVYDTKGYPAPGTTDSGTLEHQHVIGPVQYSVTPPVGGPHNGTWMNCGIYTAAVPSERAVHNLEHGAVWITYRPSLDAAGITSLTNLVLGQKDPAGATNRYMDLSPWSSDALPAPVVISAWGRQLRVQSPTDPRLQQFIDAFRSKQGISPELGSPCDGVPVDQGGRPAVS